MNNKTIANVKTEQCEGVCVGGGGILWFGVKYFEMLTFCHRIISDPNQSPSDISSDVLLKIVLSPVNMVQLFLPSPPFSTTVPFFKIGSKISY